MAIGLFAGFCIVVLVIGFCGVKGAGGDELGGDGKAPFFEFGDEVVGDLFLLFSEVEDRGAVLGADIGALAMVLGGVVQLEKGFCKSAVVGLARVEEDLDGFGVSGEAGRDFFIGWVCNGASNIAGGDFFHTGKGFKEVLNAPKATAGEEGARKSFLGGCGKKAQREGVDAVAGVFRSEALALEDVAEVALAAGAEDFGALSIGASEDGPFKLGIKARPAAVGGEFSGG